MLEEKKRGKKLSKKAFNGDITLCEIWSNVNP